MALGDRFYAKPLGLRAVLDQGADFIVRLGWSSLRLIQPDGTPLVWERLFGLLAPGQITERRVAVERSGKGGKQRGHALFEARLIVLRLPAAARAPDAAHDTSASDHAGEPHSRPPCDQTPTVKLAPMGSCPWLPPEGGLLRPRRRQHASPFAVAVPAMSEM